MSERPMYWSLKYSSTCSMVCAARDVRHSTASVRFARPYSPAMLLAMLSCSWFCLLITSVSASACCGVKTSARRVRAARALPPGVWCAWWCVPSALGVSLGVAHIASQPCSSVTMSSSASDTCGRPYAGLSTKLCVEKLGGWCVQSTIAREYTPSCSPPPSCERSRERDAL